MCNSNRKRNMHSSVNIASVAIVLMQLIVHSCSAANSSAPTYYHGLLSDVLEIYNNENNLSITPLCGQQLESIQMGINVKEIWAMKREYSFTSTCNCCMFDAMQLALEVSVYIHTYIIEAFPFGNEIHITQITHITFIISRLDALYMQFARPVYNTCKKNLHTY